MIINQEQNSRICVKRNLLYFKEAPIFKIQPKRIRMTLSQEDKIKQLLEKYNDILLESMRLAVSEDLINLIIVNRDDSDFELNKLIQEKRAFSNYVLKQFFKQNNSSVLKDLGTMKEPISDLSSRFRKT